MLKDWQKGGERMTELDTVYEHGRVLSGPSHVAYDITNMCNLRCLHCYNRSGGSDFRRNELTDDEVRGLYDQIMEIRPRSLCFCGGEPLLRLELLLEGAARLSKAGTFVAMVTNGLLLTREVALRLREAGVVLIQISVDGLTAESHDRLRGRKGAWEAAINALAMLSDIKFPSVGVAFCPTQFSIDEVIPAIGMLDRLNIREFRIQPLMLLGRAVLNRHEILPTEQQYLDMVRKLSQLEVRPTLRLEWGDPVDHLLRFARLMPESVPFLDIKSDGRLAPSTYLPLSVGSIRRHTLREYWDHGMTRVWTSPLVQKMAGMIRSTRDFYRPDSPVPMVYYEEHLHADLFEDGLLTMSDEQADRLIIDHCSRTESA